MGKIKKIPVHGIVLPSGSEGAGGASSPKVDGDVFLV